MLCGGPGMGGGAHAPGVDGAAMAASAVMSVFPCSKAAGALAHPELAAAARQVAATETILTHWGSKVCTGEEEGMQRRGGGAGCWGQDDCCGAPGTGVCMPIG